MKEIKIELLGIATILLGIVLKANSFFEYFLGVLAFSRLFASVILNPYVFSLVFALMSENKGNFLLFTADYLVQQPCGGTLRFPCSVSVDRHRGIDIGVP